MAITIALFALTMSCSKSKPEALVDPIPVDTIPVDTAIIELGKVSVLKNGVPWNASFYARYNTGDFGNFIFSGKATNNSLDEGFHLYDIPSKKGIYLVERSMLWNHNNNIPNGGLGIVLDLDQLLNYYRVDSTRANQYFEILRYDSVTHIVEGRFQTFLEGPSDYPFLPDSIALTEGKFHLKIEEQ